MKYLVLLFVILLMPTAIAQIPIIEFNFTKSPGGILKELPRSILIPESRLFSTEGEKTILHIDELIDLHDREYQLSVNALKGINVTIVDADAIIIPEPDWFGEQTIIISITGIEGDLLKKISLQRQQNVFLNEVNLPQLKTVVFDDILFRMFNYEIQKLVAEKPDIASLPIKTQFKDDSVLVLVGEDVQITTAFEETEIKRKKPIITIEVVADLLETSPSIAHCSDGIQNENELGIDCGGNCKSCQESTDYPNLYFVLIFFVVIVAFVVYNREAMLDFVEDIFSKEIKKPRKNIKKIVLKKLYELQLNLNDKSPGEILDELDHILRIYFHSSLPLRKQFTYEELLEELQTKRVKSKLKKELQYLLQRMNEIKYSGNSLQKREVNNFVVKFQYIVNKLPSRLR